MALMAKKAKKWVANKSKRKYDGVQFEKIRKKVDVKFMDLHDELSDCFYNYWKEGKSKSFQGYDVQPTLLESRNLFNKLHGCLHCMLEKKWDDTNKAEIQKDKKMEDHFNKVHPRLGTKRIDIVDAKIAKFQSEGITITPPKV